LTDCGSPRVKQRIHDEQRHEREQLAPRIVDEISSMRSERPITRPIVDTCSNWLSD
jgi:hypothetical protein